MELRVARQVGSTECLRAITLRTLSTGWFEHGADVALPKRLQPMLATLTDRPFDDAGGFSRTNMMDFAWWRKSKTAR